MSIAQSTYSAIENHSSPRKSVTRLAACTKNAIPAPAAASRTKYSAMFSSRIRSR